MNKLFLIYWGIAGLLALDITLRAAQPRGSDAVPTDSLATLTVVEALRTRCELPAGTVVFVMRGEAE